MKRCAGVIAGLMLVSLLGCAQDAGELETDIGTPPTTATVTTPTPAPISTTPPTTTPPPPPKISMEESCDQLFPLLDQVSETLDEFSDDSEDSDPDPVALAALVGDLRFALAVTTEELAPSVEVLFDLMSKLLDAQTGGVPSSEVGFEDAVVAREDIIDRCTF